MQIQNRIAYRVCNASYDSQLPQLTNGFSIYTHTHTQKKMYYSVLTFILNYLKLTNMELNVTLFCCYYASTLVLQIQSQIKF